MQGELGHDPGGDQDLHEAAAQDPDELPEGPEDHVPGLVEDQIHPVEEAVRARAPAADDPVDRDGRDESRLERIEVLHARPLNATTQHGGRRGS